MATQPGYLGYNDFKKIYEKNQKAFKFYQGSSRSSGNRWYDSELGKVDYNDYDAFVDKYNKETEAQKKAAASAQAAQQVQPQPQSQQQAAAAPPPAVDNTLASIQQQVASLPPTAAVSPIEQLAQQYQQQISNYQSDLTKSQETLFSQLARQQEEQQRKATDMFAGYQQYTNQLRGDWQAGLQQTRDLIGGLSNSYNQQLQGLQGILTSL